VVKLISGRLTQFVTQHCVKIGKGFMTSHPPKDLLEQTHSFPGRFMFKAIGRAHDDFAIRVVAAVRQTLEQDFDAPYELRESSGGRHIAVTIEPWVESSNQVIAIYAAIRALDGLVMLM
jgi:putative lipoic acid-binding regulatory protein